MQVIYTEDSISFQAENPFEDAYLHQIRILKLKEILDSKRSVNDAQHTRLTFQFEYDFGDGDEEGK